MAGSEGHSNSYDSSQIMQAELENHLNEFRRSEQLGENRLNIYLTIVTAVLGGSSFLVYFQTQDGVSDLEQLDLRIIFFACFATLIFGLLTLLRMVHRNLMSHEELRAANRIRRYFVERDQNILKYLRYPPCDDKPIREWKWKNGGLVDTVVLLNSLLVAIIIAILMAILSPYLTRIWLDLLFECAVLSGILADWTMMIYLLVAIIMAILVDLRSPIWSDSFIAFAGLSGFFAAWIIQIVFVKNEYVKARDKIVSLSPCRSPSISKELETVIVVASDDPKSIANEIEGLSSIGGYFLLYGSPKNIRDRYFDTNAKDLNSQKLALRIREINGDKLLTLKGPSVPRGEAMQRMEIEKKWSHEAFEHVLEELRSRKIEISLPEDASRNDMTKPNAFQNQTSSEIKCIMSRYGLKEIQDRETSRIIRNVVSERYGPILAELAIDRVCYHLNDESIVFYEVEIENKSQDDGFDVIGAVGIMLLMRYPEAMHRWTHSKLEIGKAIDEINPHLHKGDFLEIINDKKDSKTLYLLKAAAFDEIDRHIREKKKETQ
jgi:hypothetical protein